MEPTSTGTSRSKLFKINTILAHGWKRVSVMVWKKEDKIVSTAEEAFEEVRKKLRENKSNSPV